MLPDPSRRDLQWRDLQKDYNDVAPVRFSGCAFRHDSATGLSLRRNILAAKR
jgi:hypothetical protein